MIYTHRQGGEKMNIDLSTISATGLVGLVILTFAALCILTLLIKSKPKIKGSKGSIEFGGDLPKEGAVKVEIAPHETPDLRLRQMTMARNEIKGMIEEIYDTDGHENADAPEATISRLRCELFGSKLLYGISRCYALNNIGKTNEEIEAYSNRTARELSYLLEVFPDWEELEKKLGENWFSKKLFIIFKDGKSIS
jgi:hypothetical protein